MESKANLRVCFFYFLSFTNKGKYLWFHSRCLRSTKRDVGFDLAIYNYKILQIKKPAIHRLWAFLNALLVNPSKSGQGLVLLWLVGASRFYNK